MVQAEAARTEARYRAAIADARETAGRGGGYGEDLVEVSDWEGQEPYIRALAAYKAARKSRAPNMGVKKIARQHGIPHARLTRMYNRDCERQRLVLESSDDDSF